MRRASPRAFPWLFALALAGLAVLPARPARAGDSPGAADQEGRWAKRGWFWLNAEGGAESIHLWTFHADFDRLTAGFVQTNGFGPAAGLGLGARLSFVTLGARARVVSLQDGAPDQSNGSWQLWTLDGELGLHVPLRRVEPYLHVAGGYAAIGGLGSAVNGLKQGVDVNGANLRGGVGADLFLTPRLSLGLDISGEGLFLARPGVSIRDLMEAKQVNTLNQAKARIGDADGASAGWSLTFTAGLGLHL
jgi:hypothetical protein